MTKDSSVKKNRKSKNDLKLQELEIIYKEELLKSLTIENKRKYRLNISIITIIIGGLISLFTVVIGNIIQNNNSLKQNKIKLESDLILKAIDTDNRFKSVENLQFLLNLNLIQDSDSLLRKAINDNQAKIPALKASNILHVKVLNKSGEPVSDAQIYIEDIFIGSTNITGDLIQYMSSNNLGMKEFKVFKNGNECDYYTISNDRNNNVIIEVNCLK